MKLVFSNRNGDNRRFALTVAYSGQILSSTTNEKRATEFPDDSVQLQAKYFYSVPTRQKWDIKVE